MVCATHCTWCRGRMRFTCSMGYIRGRPASYKRWLCSWVVAWMGWCVSLNEMPHRVRTLPPWGANCMCTVVGHLTTVTMHEVSMRRPFGLSKGYKCLENAHKLALFPTWVKMCIIPPLVSSPMCPLTRPLWILFAFQHPRWETSLFSLVLCL